MRPAGLVLALVVATAACTTPGSEAVPTVPPPPATSAPATSAAVTSTTVTQVGLDAGSGLGDRMFPALGNAGYDVMAYTIDLTVDPAGSHVSGDVTVEAVATTALQSFVVDFVGHAVHTVEVDGSEADFVRDARDMRIIPSQVIPAGAEFVVRVVYAGTAAPVTLTDFTFPTGWQTGDDASMFLFSQPDGASGVFPANDHPSDRADVTLTVRVPAPAVVVSGGVRRPVEVDGEQLVYGFDMVDIAPYLVPLAIGDFEPVVTPDGVTTWLADGASLPAGFDRQAEILAELEADLGPYPFAQSGAVVVDSHFPAALETQTLATYTATSAAWGTPVIAHELAHHWFGNDIALGQWDDIWLNEGPATFMTWRWIEVDRGREAYESEVRRAWDAVVAAELPPPDDPPGQDLFNVSVYQRGGLALVALREFVGDDAFFDFLRAYVAAFADGTVTTEAFLTLVLVVLGPDAEQLVTDWVRAEQVPPLPLP